MAGQVRHKQIFSSIRPDWRLAKLLLSLTTRNTDSLLGAVAKVLAEEGITLESSTWLLEPLLVKPGVLTKREPTEQERKNIEYGRGVARNLAQHDIGQTVVIAESACVAVEAMEGTDATIERAGQIMRSMQGDASTLSRASDCGEDREAESGYAVRCAGYRREDDRSHARGRGFVSGVGCGKVPAAGWGENYRGGERGRDRDRRGVKDRFDEIEECRYSFRSHSYC